MNNNLMTIRVWGDFACFTRPEMKVERVSYPIMTPSAARGILEAIFWEPQMYYLIDSIRVVKRGRWFSFRRNEVTKVISLDSAQTWMRQPNKWSPIEAGGGAADAAQRNMLALQEVEYFISAEIRTTCLADRISDTLHKYAGEFERRTRQGKCFHRPYLGVREFAADFEWVGEDIEVAFAQRLNELRAENLATEPFTEDLGLMLYDVFNWQERGMGFRWLREEETTNTIPLESSKKRRQKSHAEADRHLGCRIEPTAAFFHARVERSRLDCHPERVSILNPLNGGN